MSYWSDETERLERLAREAIADRDLSAAKYWLRRRNEHRVPTTVEWIVDGLCPLGMMFREMVLNNDDEGLKSEFWMNLEEARHMLACVDLATLPAWDAGALVEALTIGWDEYTSLTHSGMSKQQIERRISLAQASGQLGLTFLAKDALDWAKRMGIAFPDRVLLEAVEKLSPHFDGSFEERWQAWCAAKESPALESPVIDPENAEEATASNREQRPESIVRKKRQALIDEYRKIWPTIETDLNEGSRNGLGKARLEEHGFYDERIALQWAEERGKIKKSSTSTAPSTWTSIIHRAE